MTTVTLPMRLPSVANLRLHWATKARMVKAQRGAVRLALVHRIGSLSSGERAVVTLTRVAPRQLDSDNLASAFKACRDSVADLLGVDDGGDRVAWLYRQERGPAAVRIDVEVVR